MLDDLRARGVHVHSLTENIDTETPTGRAMWQMVALLAELERSLIIERTRAGMQAARARGVRPGPKPKLSRPQIDHARKLHEQGDSADAIADILRVSRATVYRALTAVAG
jgi:DNA invertase Pin-like site-specific DNA recombinase